MDATNNAVHQYRKVGCSDWYDGYPDNSDGRGPYESRTLYAAATQPQPTAVSAPSDEPIYWLEAEESARNRDPRDVVGKHSMLYSTQITKSKPTGNNPCWPLYLHPAAHAAAPVSAPPSPQPVAESVKPIAWLRFWAAQYYTGQGDIECDEGYEVCKEGEKGADGSPAFPVFDTPAAALQPVAGLTDAEINAMWDAHVTPVFGKAGISPYVFARAIEAHIKGQTK